MYEPKLDFQKHGISKEHVYLGIIDVRESDLAFFSVEKERKKAEKAKKFTEKQTKKTSNVSAPQGKGKPPKKENVKDVPASEYVEETPPGEKKCKYEK